MKQNTRIQFRRGTSEALAAVNEVPLAGEIGIETDTGKYKIGNGSTNWNGLPYAGQNFPTDTSVYVLKNGAYTPANVVDMSEIWQPSISEALTPDVALSVNSVKLGYTSTQDALFIDEFVFRHNAGSGVPEVPTTAYGTEIVPVEVPSAVNNAPVSRATWSCENLPEGLTLSSAGVLSGHPTTAGTYECEFSVSTNWGTAMKTIRVVVS